MPKQIVTDEKRKLGQVVIDFVNARNTDDAFSTLIEGLKDIFGPLSSDIEQVKNGFPSFRPIEDLEPPKRKLFDLLLEIKRMVEKTTGPPYFKEPNIEFLKYDYDGRIFLKLHYYDWTSDPYDPSVRSEEFSCLLEHLKEELLEVFCGFNDLIDPEEIKAFCSTEHKDLDAIKHIAKEICSVKSRISKSDVEHISELVRNCEPAIACKEVLADIQTNLRQALTMMIERVDLEKIQTVIDCLVRYNEMPKKRLIIKGNSFFVAPPFSIQSDKVRQKSSSRDLIPRVIVSDVKCTVREIISYCLIEFLREERSRDYLGRCENEECRKYFIATRLNRQRFCSGKCRQDYNNRERIRSGEHARYKREKKKAVKQQRLTMGKRKP